MRRLATIVSTSVTLLRVHGLAIALWLGPLLLLAGAADRSAETIPAKYVREKAKATFARPQEIPFPADNAPTPVREELGKLLFFDPRLSGSNSISCASCHNPALGWGDGLAKGVGHGSAQLARRTPTILNTAFAELLFWDGRAASLEEQALGPISSPQEMNQPLETLPAELKQIAAYRSLFEKAYPREGITPQTIGKAIAVFERTVVSRRAPFDAWVEGDEEAISEPAKRGFDVFNTKASCVQCHSGWNFTDDGFHDIGIKGDDIGRGKFLPNIAAVQHAFKTPTLRNADQRAPFMHDGSEKTLEECVEFYNRGGDVRRPSTSDDVHALGLTQQEIDDLCAFMRTLSSQDAPVTIPILPR